MDAISDYNKAILINSEYQTAYVNRGNIKSDIEDYEGALMDYSMALNLNPDDISAHFNRGYTLKLLGNY